MKNITMSFLILLVIGMTGWAYARENVSYESVTQKEDVYELVDTNEYVICNCPEGSLTKSLKVPISIRITEHSKKMDNEGLGYENLEPGASSNSENKEKVNVNVSGEGETNIGQYTFYFDFDKYRLNTDEEKKFDEFIKAINGECLIYEIHGYTDEKGSKTYNDQLALKRAKEIYKKLLSKGVKEDQINGVYGDGKCCYAGNKDSLNRRVEVKPNNNKGEKEQLK